jgi:hypothetical protein
MVADRIPYLVCKRGLWRAYGPDDSAVEAGSLAELREKLSAIVRARFGEGFAPVFMVGPRKPPRSALPSRPGWQEPELVARSSGAGAGLLGR